MSLRDLPQMVLTSQRKESESMGTPEVLAVNLQGACDDLIKANEEAEVEYRRADEVKEASPPRKSAKKKNHSLDQLVKSPALDAGARAAESASMTRRKGKEVVARSHSDYSEERVEPYPQLPSYHMEQWSYDNLGSFPMYGAPHPFPMYGAHRSPYTYPPVPHSCLHTTDTQSGPTSREADHDKLQPPTARTYPHPGETKDSDERRASTKPYQQRRTTHVPLVEREMLPPPLLRNGALEEEYSELYRQRDSVQERMHEIRGALSGEKYRALVARIEGSPVAVLKCSLPGKMGVYIISGRKV
ncbi:hypothetical protein NX059_001908 [Plenodomus lindquistii]|nr:hypothetical protein NX059_001908 [Plenodomus lindquistii]